MKRKYVKTSCHDSYEGAAAKAQEMRTNGQTASIRDTATGTCIYSAGERLGRKSKPVSGTPGETIGAGEKASIAASQTS
ncbi:hypothetical protein [Lewinella sp. LCG006]|uniref:hypothetical protein n=1 Tax=Lewinella sp. LCG006 TaxID=3231911 RepID=UPI003460AD53